MNIPFVASLLLEVLNEALLCADIPLSWLDTTVTLLHKKGDRSDLKNWRPFSLINTDAKILTKLLANRLHNMLPKIIGPYQTGFVKNRFIADNGVAASLSMFHAKKFNLPGIALLLDQEKAYDRVHPEFLRATLIRLKFPISFINSIAQIFFQTNLNISINGFFSAPIKQGRGIRQGDPLSPLLYNIVFEPLLRQILNNQSLQGFRFSDETNIDYHNHSNLPRIKYIAYADDLLVYLNNTLEFETLQTILSTYSLASNATINYSKTNAVSLSGKRSLDWTRKFDTVGIQFFDSTSSSAPIYLGYPLTTVPKTRDTF